MLANKLYFQGVITLLMFYGHDHSMVTYDLKEGSSRCELSVARKADVEFDLRNGSPNFESVSPDGRLVAVYVQPNETPASSLPPGNLDPILTSDSAVQVYSTKDMRPVASFTTPGIYGVSWSPDSKSLFFGRYDSRLTFVELSTGRMLTTPWPSYWGTWSMSSSTIFITPRARHAEPRKTKPPQWFAFYTRTGKLRRVTRSQFLAGSGLQPYEAKGHDLPASTASTVIDQWCPSGYLVLPYNVLASESTMWVFSGRKAFSIRYNLAIYWLKDIHHLYGVYENGYDPSRGSTPGTLYYVDPTTGKCVSKEFEVPGSPSLIYVVRGA